MPDKPYPDILIGQIAAAGDKGYGGVSMDELRQQSLYYWQGAETRDPGSRGREKILTSILSILTSGGEGDSGVDMDREDVEAELKRILKELDDGE